MGKTSDQARRSFQTFCDGTSMHGFMELFHAKSAVWTAFWTVLLTAAIGLTAYQVTKAILQFTNQETNSRNVPADQNDMYPPAMICYQHWIYWVDWEKAYSLNFTKHSVLYGMSFLSNVYTSDSFELELAKEQFQLAMKLNGITRLQEFYKIVAKSFPFDVNTPNGSQVLFQEICIFDSVYIGPTLCYKTLGETIQNYVKDHKAGEAPALNFTVKSQSYSTLKQYMTMDEYNWYMSTWIMNTWNYVSDDGSQYANFSTFTLYLLLYVDGFSQDYVPIMPEDDFYTISASVRVNRWRSDSNTWKCLVDERFIRTNRSILDHCNIQYDETVCTCQTLAVAVTKDSDHPDTLCRLKIFSVSPNNTTLSIIESENDTNINVEKMSCVKNNSIAQMKNSCVQQCVVPCEIWSYGFSFIAEKTGAALINNGFTKIATYVRIVYPLEEDIYIMVEVDRQTWEDFVANIGGLLGVWTGASLLSIVQIFYLCCFSHIEPKRILKQKNRNVIMTFDQSDEFVKNSTTSVK